VSLRLKTEDALTARLTAAEGKPAAYVVQAGHRIANLALPAVVVHAETSEPVVEGSERPERKVTVNCTVMTPVETATAVTTHRGAFEWLNGALAATTALTTVTFMGAHLGAEQTGTNEKVAEDGVQYVVFVAP
jgi:hypothetical protein